MLQVAERPLLHVGQGVRLAGAQAALFELLAQDPAFAVPETWMLYFSCPPPALAESKPAKRCLQNLAPRLPELRPRPNLFLCWGNPKTPSPLGVPVLWH